MPDTPNTIRWTPARAPFPHAWPVPSVARAVARGLRCRCPSCGRARLFKGYLRLVDACASCGAPVGLVSADDAPPYFTIFIVGHVVVLGMILLETAYAPPLWLHAAIWLPLTLVLSLGLLRPIKGGTVGLMLKLGLFKPSDGC